MRVLTADTIIRVRSSRPTPAKRELTGDTRIRLSQIVDLKTWRNKYTKDTDKPGTVKHWSSDDKDHRKQPDGSWPVVGSKEDKIGKERISESTERAKKLSLSMWGSPQEVIEQATPERTARSFAEAKSIMKNFVGHSFVNKEGLPGHVSEKSLKKLLSGKAVKSSFELKAHLQAAANMDKLYSNSIEPFEPEPDKNGNPDVKAIHRTYAPLLLEENGEKRIIPVKFTVKEYSDKNTKNKLYSIEAVDFDLNEKKRTSNLAGDAKASPMPGCSLFYFILHQ